MSEQCLLHTDSLRSRLLCAGVLYGVLPVESWAIRGSLGVLVAVDCMLSPTDRGNGLASSSRPGEREREHVAVLHKQIQPLGNPVHAILLREGSLYSRSRPQGRVAVRTRDPPQRAVTPETLPP